MDVGGVYQFNSSTVPEPFIPPNATRLLQEFAFNFPGFDPGIFRSHSFTDDDVTCLHLYRTTSKGLWRNPSFKDDGLTSYSLLLFGIQVTICFAVTNAFQLILNPLGFPPVFGQILVGILLGDSNLGIMVGRIIGYRDVLDDGAVDALTILFPTNAVVILNNFGTIGFMLFQFLLGVKMDPSMIWNSGRKATAIGISTTVVPLILGLCTTSILKNASTKGTSHKFHMFYYISGVQSMSTFPVIASLLTDLKMLNSDLGRIALSSSMVGELGNTIILLAINNWKLKDSTMSKEKYNRVKVHKKFQFRSAWKPICRNQVGLCGPLSCVIYVLFIVFVVRRAMTWVIKQTPRGKPVKNIYIVLILLGVLFSGLISVAIGQNALFGPFIYGLAIPDGPPLGTTLVVKLDSLVTGLLMPIFVTVSGLRTVLEYESYFGEFSKILVIMIGVSTLGKMVGTMVPCLFCRMPIRDALVLAFMMSAKGMVELFIYNIWRDTEILTDQIFSYMVIFVTISTAIVPLVVRSLYDPNSKYSGYAKRTILHTKMSAELRILVCVNQEENVPTIIKILQASNPAKESPISVYALHLVELAGRTAPMLISHQKKKEIKPSNSEHVVNAFRNYEQQYQEQGAVTVQAFTSISPFKTMHEDICSLALNKCTAFIIIPFHKEWAVDGTMGSGKFNLRTLNDNVLEKAPCSVGILVDRGHITATASNLLMQSSYRVAVLFFGGADDREALSFAKRMSENTNVYITVVQLFASGDDEDYTGVKDEWGAMLDSEVLKDFKYSTMSNQRVVYKEEVVTDGGQTAWVVRSLENEQDLIIVGRHLGLGSPITLGLTEWSECQELGIIGDMLASSDVKAGVSVLVVQQCQMHIASSP